MQAIIDLLIKNANLYKDADTRLGIVCGDTMDPIACTVYARKNMHAEYLPAESHDAAFYLNEVVRLHGILVVQYGMDSDVIRDIWFPILN